MVQSDIQFYLKAHVHQHITSICDHVDLCQHSSAFTGHPSGLMAQLQGLDISLKTEAAYSLSVLECRMIRARTLL